MAQVAWPAPFPLGIADTESSLGFCKALHELVVLNLADGAVLWRLQIDGQPLLVGQGVAIVLCAGEVLAFPIAGPGRHAPQWRVSLPTMPTEAEAAWIDGDIGVRWQSRERFRGGIPDASTTHTKSGQCCIRPSTGSARPLADWPARPCPAQWEASDDPNVLSACVLGATRYCIASAPGKGLTELKLTATSAVDGTAMWECLLSRP